MDDGAVASFQTVHPVATIAPSAHQMKRGQGRIQSNFAHNVAHLGGTDRLSMSAWLDSGRRHKVAVGNRERMRVGLATLWAIEGRLQQLLGNEEALKNLCFGRPRCDLWGCIEPCLPVSACQMRRAL